MSQEKLNPRRQDILGLPGNISAPLMSLVELLPDVEKDFRIHKGKVRESVDLGENLLMVATDRISTFDVVHPNGIPGKGTILTQMTVRWLDLLGGVVQNHLITAKIEEFPEPFNIEALRGRSMLVKKLRMIPIECIARGYITGSAMAEYGRTGAVSGIKLPSGLVESQKLEEPIFTPSTKATVGHDENIDFERMEAIIRGNFPGLDARNLAKDLKEKTLTLYMEAANYALSRGIIIADTKVEFGLNKKGVLVLGDEVITPDSSRFWDEALYQPGRSQNSLDKQYVRDYGTSIRWNRQSPAPSLPSEVVNRTSQKYAEVHKRLFG